MVDIIKIYRQPVPAMRFVGKRYSDADRVEGGFMAQWMEWFANGWFEELQSGFDPQTLYENGDATIGLMRWKEGEPFQYWIGVFCPENVEVPEGYEFVDFPPGELGVAWVYGKQGEVFCHEYECAQRCMDQGYEIICDEEGAYWFFERNVCPRFTTPDEQGNIILDICHFVRPEN